MKTSKNNKKSEKERIILYLHTLLEKQEKILKKFISLAEKEKNTISTGDEEKLHQYKNLENAFIKEADAHAKVILAFDTLYSESGYEAGQEIINLKTRISRLNTRLLSLNKENTKALKKQMQSLKEELEILSKKKRKKPSPFKKIGTPSYIDIKA